MSDFDYGNARLHAMKSQLLTRQVLLELAGAGTVRSLLNALTKTVYREAVEISLVQFSDMEAINRTLRHDLVNTISKARGFFRGKAADSVAWVMRRYDVDNVKAILRGLTQHVPANEILLGTLPVGQLLSADLTRMARVTNARSAIDLLATWRIPLVQPLLGLRAEVPGANLFEMELALERWYYRSAMAKTGVNGSSALRQSLRVGADVANILTALRMVGLVEVESFIRQRLNVDDATPLFVGPGSISFDLLADVARQPSIRRAIQKLDGTAYGDQLAGALRRYAATEQLTVFEDVLVRHQLKRAKTLLFTDPLGIGVMIGYLALKTTEINNLHRIAMGLGLSEEPDQTRSELIFVDEL